MTAEDLVTFDNKKLLDFFKLDQCPDWAEWVAVDSDGTVCYYSAEPTLNTYKDEWRCETARHNLRPVRINGNNIKITVEDWTKAKVKRPSTGNEMFLGKCRGIHIHMEGANYIVSFECSTDDIYDKDSYYLELTVEHSLAAEIFARDLGHIIAEWLGKDVSVENKSSHIRSALQSSIPEAFSAAVTGVRLSSGLGMKGLCRI